MRRSISLLLPAMLLMIISYMAFSTDTALATGGGSLGNFVWHDVNGNGIQDAGEPGVPYVEVKLCDCDHVLLAVARTDVNGFYYFSNVDAYLKDCFILNFEAPAGYTFTLQDQGGDDTVDSDVIPTLAETAPIPYTPGQNNHTIDAGLETLPTGKATLGDFVFEDLNQNGIQESGEPGIADVAVVLLDCNGNVLNSTRTDANGKYSFTNLVAGCSYIVQFDQPTGFTYSPLNQGSDDSKDSDANPAANGRTGPIQLGDGENNPTVDAGFFRPTPVKGSLGDRVWRDDNGNGIQDSNEPGIAGIAVQLQNCSNNVLQTTTTNSSGNYNFANLNAGCYVVRFTNINSNDFAFTAPNQGGDDTKDSDVTKQDSVTPGTVNGETEPINLAQGENNPTIDAGLTPRPANVGSIGDRVWRDDNGNGIQDAGEPGINGVTVVLRNPGANNSCDASDAVITSQSTTGDGNYLFGGLAAGRYCADPDQNTVPTGLTLTTNNDPQTVDLSPGQNFRNADFGYQPPAPLGSIGNRVWNDLNQNGIQDTSEPGLANVTVQLKDCSGNVIRTRVTDSNGNYGFNNLSAGCYIIGVVVPNGFQISPKGQGGDIARDSDINPGNAMSDPINLTAGQNIFTVDAGLFQPQLTGSLGDRVWRDHNGNGIQDDGEPGVAGVTVQLKECNNNIIRTTTTDGNGNYSFTNLAAGCYRIGIVAPGFTLSPANQGGDDTKDSDVDPATAMTGDINLSAGENNPTIDAGLFTPPPPGSIGDRVFDDLNSNGIQDDGEPGVSNVTVQLKDCNNNVLRTTITNSSGNYLFNNLNAGCYTIGVVLPTGRIFSPANQGADDTRDSDINPATGMTGPINLDPGENDLTNDAGLRTPLTCGLTVDQKCQVAAPPPTSNFVCSDAKPLNELSMIWNGSQRVDVKAWKGAVGSTLLATVTNVAPGQTVNVSGYAGAPNDVIWEIFAAGTSSKVGESTFHLSCSDANMNGPEDCGAVQGDGKDKIGFLNLWKFEGMAGNGLRLACSSTPPAPAESCTVMAGSASVCNGSKPKALTFRYTGGSCANSTNPQSGKFTCSGNPGTGTVTIAVTGKEADKFSITPSSVSPGQEFTLARSDGKDFPADTRLQVGGQALAIHTSCSQALNLGDVFGSLVLVAANGQRLDTPVTFTYLIANNGDALSNVTLEDDFGAVAAPFNLARGATQNFQRQTTIAETTSNVAFAEGFLADGQLCEASDETTVVVEAPALSCKDGKPIALTFEYTGGSCSDTTNSQSGKLQCSGTPGGDPAAITILKDADKISVRPSSVNRGQRFTIARTDGREFASETLLRVGGQSLNLHTSCSQQLNVGDVFGSLRLVVFTPKGFPLPASVDGETEMANQIFLPLIEQK